MPWAWNVNWVYYSHKKQEKQVRSFLQQDTVQKLRRVTIGNRLGENQIILGHAQSVCIN